jgi:riboflavin kinase / FMN adenylyltransferase
LKIYRNIEDFPKIEFPVVTIGTFDGVHVGHQQIIKRMIEVAKKNNGETVLVTFSPHPRLVIHADSQNLKFINTQDRKYQLMEQFGIDHLVEIPFTKEFSKTSSNDFIENIIVKGLGTRKLIIGYDHHFGKNRMGDYNKLFDLGLKYGFKVEKVNAQSVNNINVSSTKIRKALEEGKIKVANQLLGYEYSITGKVVEGNKIGRKIGFPTANIDLLDQYKLITANGVYACRAKWNGKFFNGMSNIGVRPTVNHGELTIEINIFDFKENLYGQEITIFFVDRIRDEIKFANIEKLRLQLIKDRKTTLRMIHA